MTTAGPTLEASAFVDFRDVWLAYTDEDRAAARYAVEAITLQARRGEFWRHIEPKAAVGGYVILITTAPRGTIPAELWRKSHVIYL